VRQSRSRRLGGWALTPVYISRLRRALFARQIPGNVQGPLSDDHLAIEAGKFRAAQHLGSAL
jgi:hypothetical protein